MVVGKTRESPEPKTAVVLFLYLAVVPADVFWSSHYGQ